jgi:hypothetical protein
MIIQPHRLPAVTAKAALPMECNCAKFREFSFHRTPEYQPIGNLLPNRPYRGHSGTQRHGRQGKTPFSRRNGSLLFIRENARRIQVRIARPPKASCGDYLAFGKTRFPIKAYL